MYVRRHFGLGATIGFSYRGGLLAGAWALVITSAHEFLGLESLKLPALPVTVLGTAVAFYLGFKGNAAYDRLWEARKIWGGIVNTSRTWGAHVIAMVTDLSTPDPGTPLLEVHRELILRHIGWMSALRTQLRRRKSWEHARPGNDAYREARGTLDMSADRMRQRLEPYIAHDELEGVMRMANQATQLVFRQGERLRDLRAEGRIDDFRHMELAGLLEELYTLQGKCERIKNFPLPRQYASANQWFMLVFLALVPFAMLSQFGSEVHGTVWYTVPVSALVGWVFYTWDLVVDYSENPFEGLVNDIPMDSLSRTIEIDLLQMLQSETVPEPIVANDNGGLF